MYHAALLDIKDTVEIINLAWDHRARWRFIGIELGIDQGTLDAISADERDVGDRLTRMINIWLRNTEPRPTQSAIKAALASERVSGTV